jgi:hypothetical protein
MSTTESTTPAQVREARGWIADCFGEKLAKRLTVAEVVAGVARHYEGGWAQFIADGS